MLPLQNFFYSLLPNCYYNQSDFCRNILYPIVICCNFCIVLKSKGN